MAEAAAAAVCAAEPQRKRMTYSEKAESCAICVMSVCGEVY